MSSWSAGFGILARFLVAAQLLDHGAVGRERLKDARTLLGGVDLAIHIKDVLPGLAVDGAGLDFGEVGADGGEFRERGDEPSGTIFDGKGEADLVGLGIGN